MKAGLKKGLAVEKPVNVALRWKSDVVPVLSKRVCNMLLSYITAIFNRYTQSGKLPTFKAGVSFIQRIFAQPENC